MRSPDSDSSWPVTWHIPQINGENALQTPILIDVQAEPAAVKRTSKRLPHQVIISPLLGLQGENMSDKISRRKFVRSAAAIAAFSSVPVAESFGSLVQNNSSTRT